MSKNHLFLPSSFFPSIGGSQGSMLNFIDNANYKGKVYMCLGLSGFNFSLNKQRNYSILPMPYFLVNKVPALGLFFLYLAILFLRINVLWLYGGGVFAATILKNKRLFRKVTVVLRSCGEDIQKDIRSNYGLQGKDEKLVMDYYKNCDLAWAISREIEELYAKKCSIKAEKIIRCPNVIKKRKIKNLALTTPNQRLQVGIIGRYHKKKQFELALDVALSLKQYDFHFKTPGFNVNVKRSNIYFHNPSIIEHLLYWPPDDVHKFYNKIELLLICSRVESFGNVNFEAAVNGVSVLINQDVTGGDILQEIGYPVFYFNSFELEEISNSVISFDEKRKLTKRIPLPEYDNSFANKLANLEI